MVSPEALTACCNTATAIIYENIKTRNKSTIYKDALQEGEGSGDEIHGGSAWDAALSQALSGAVEMVDLLDSLDKSVEFQREPGGGKEGDEGKEASGRRRGHHYIYVLTNTVSVTCHTVMCDVSCVACHGSFVEFHALLHTCGSTLRSFF